MDEDPRLHILLVFCLSLLRLTLFGAEALVILYVAGVSLATEDAE